MPHPITARQSAYYPRRARGWRAPRRLVGALRAAMHLERIPLPAWHSVRNTVAAVLLPGLAFHWEGPRLLARIMWMGLPVLLLVFLAGLGTLVAEVAFGLMIGAHVTSVSHLLRPLMVRNRLALQLVFGVVLFLAASVFLYVPAREWFHREVALPLTVRGEVLIVNPRASAASVQRGDLVAYHIPQSSGGNIIVREGMGIEPVLALPGDRLVFGDGRVYVNGSAHALPGSSREWGGLVVPEHCWFIWPQLDRFNGGAVRGVEDVVRGLALVDRSQFVGCPYRWWCFRRQGST